MKNKDAIEILETMAMAESTFSDEESKKCCEAIDLAVEALKREEAGSAHNVHINSSAWKPCFNCKDEGALAKKIKCWPSYCPLCGRPLTKEARAELEKRLRG